MVALLARALPVNTADQVPESVLSGNELDIGVMTRLTVADGMSSDIVRSIYRDSHNLLWIGTSSGLNRWDGHEMRVYSGEIPGLQLQTGFVSDILEDAKSNIWLVWDNRNLVYLREYDRLVPASEYVAGLRPDTRYNILIDEKSNIWAYDEAGVLTMFDPEGKLKGGITLSRDFADMVDWTTFPDGGILILHRTDGLVRVDGNLKRSLFLSDIPGGKQLDYYNRIYVDSSGKLWIYSYHDTEIHCYDSGTCEWKSLQLPGLQNPGNCINGIIDIGDNILWISTDHQGIYVYDRNKGIFRNHISYGDGHQQSIPSDRVTEMFRDKDGNIWIGFLRDGLTVIHAKSAIRPFRNKVSADVLSVLHDKQGIIWIGTDGKGLYKSDGNGQTAKWAGVPDVAVMSISKGHDGKVFAGTYDHGMYVIDGDKTTHYSRSSGNFPTDNAWVMTVDRKGNLWFGSTADGLFKMMPDGKVIPITHPDGRQLAAVSLFDNNTDSIYVSTGHGFVRVNINTDKVSIPVTGNRRGTRQFLNNYITKIYKDSENVIWLGHLGGLTAYDQLTDSIYEIRRSDGLADNIISDITEDNRRVIWVGTYNGLTAITKHIKDDRSLRLSFTNYSVSDGLCSNYVSPNSFCRLPDSDILIGGVNGYSSLSPGLLDDEPRDRKVIFTSLKISGHEVDVDGEYDELSVDRAIQDLDMLVLNNPVREVTLGFASDDILSNSRMTYSYRIAGLSDEWIVTDKHEITVSQLPAGEYELQVRVINSNGEWSDNITTLKIEVKHPWYLRWWAIMLYILIAVVAVALVIIYRRRRLKEKIRLQKMEETNEQQRKLNEIKLQFFTNVSHDLKTPLTLILSPLQLLLKGEHDDLTRSRLSIINRNAKHLLSLIDRILDFRKLDIGGETVHPVKCEVISSLTEVCGNFMGAASERNIDIIVRSGIDHLYSETDIEKIKKSLYNVLSNALKFSPDNSKINVDFDYTDGLLGIEVSDNGPGIPDDIKKNVFLRFFQGKYNESNPGSGIGLHIVSGYVKMLRGDVTVRDNHPTGAIFKMTIPMDNREDEIEATAEANDTSVTPIVSENTSKGADVEKMPMTVLVVDDNRDLCLFLSDALGGEGYKVVMAADGAEALAALDKNNVGIVVSDVMMPGIDGIELCRKIKSDVRYSYIPVILLTAKGSDDAKIKGLECGADDYLTKPFNFDILRLRISKFIEQGKEKNQRFNKEDNIQPADITITPLDEQFIHKAVKIVEAHISDLDFDVEALSRELGISRGHLYKKLMGIIGIGPSGFIRSIRIKRGRQLLEKSQMRVSEVAYAVGFNTSKQFSISFKEQYGMTPTEYINSLKSAENQ